VILGAFEKVILYKARCHSLTEGPQGDRTSGRVPEVIETPQDAPSLFQSGPRMAECRIGVHAMSSSKNANLGSVTGRDEFIIGEALATALIALERLPEARQPTRNMADMKMLLNSLYAPPEVSLHLTTARWRFIPSSRPFGARDERGER
jgi:hypothetical protein